MPEIVRPDLASADGIEISDHLRLAGFTSIATWLEDNGLHIDVRDAPSVEAITAALAGWSPTYTRGTYLGLLPPGVIDHVQHLRDFRDAVRAGQTPSNASTLHVIADLIDAMRILVDSRLP